MMNGLERIGARFECDIEDTLISRIYSLLQSDSLGKLKDTDDYVDKEEQAEVLVSYNEANNLYFDNLRFSVYLDEGAEQKVFFDSEKSNVYKLNDGTLFFIDTVIYLK